MIEKSTTIFKCQFLGLTAFLNIKTVLNEPHLLELSNALLTATCSWLVHLASCSTLTEYDEQIARIQQLPLISKSTQYLSYTPEFIIENVIDFLTFLGRFNVQLFEVDTFLFMSND
jgi:hypothetical protein